MFNCVSHCSILKKISTDVFSIMYDVYDVVPLHFARTSVYYAFYYCFLLQRIGGTKCFP